MEMLVWIKEDKFPEIEKWMEEKNDSNLMKIIKIAVSLYTLISVVVVPL